MFARPDRVDPKTDTRRARRWGLTGVWALVVLLMLPNLVWLWRDPSLTALLSGLIVPGVFLAAFFAIFGRAPWLACLLLVPLALLAPLEAVYVASYHMPSSARVLATIMATNIEEIQSFVGVRLLFMILAPLAGGALGVWATRRAWQARLKWQTGGRWALILVASMPLATAGSVLVTLDKKPAGTHHNAQVVLDDAVASIGRGYPFGVIERVARYRKDWAVERNDTQRMKHESFHAVRVAPQPRKRQVYVLVIGESSARDHWQLFGYKRPTNPQLSKQRNLIPVTRMISSWPETIAAIPTMLTRRPITDNKPDWHEPSFLTAMKEAGFQTWWISNQYPVTRYDTPVGMYAYESENVVWVNHNVTLHDPNSYDGNLLKPLRNALAVSHKDLFIVLHMLGSHRHYNYRYPPAFEIFKPVEADAPDKRGTLPNHLLRIRNSYDNTIVYTDHVLSRIIHVLAGTDAVTALWYESDHGEILPTATCHKHGHGIGSTHEYQIPALFWYSDAYRSDFPERVAALRDNAHKRSLSADTFESMIDMAGVTFPGHDKSWSLFSNQWRERTRIVGQLRKTNFDHALIGKKCGIVLGDAPPS